MEYKIKNYVKLLCIRIDHFESQIVDEKIQMIQKKSKNLSKDIKIDKA